MYHSVQPLRSFVFLLKEAFLDVQKELELQLVSDLGFRPFPVRGRHAFNHVTLDGEHVAFDLTSIEWGEGAIEVSVKEEDGRIPVRRVLVQDTMHAALILVAGPLGEHIANIDDVGVWIGRNGHPLVPVLVEDFQAWVRVLQEQSDGAKIRVGARPQLSRLGLLRRRVMQQSQRGRGRVGRELVEHMWAIRQRASDQLQNNQREIVHRLVIPLGRGAKDLRGQDGFRRPYVRPHVEATGDGTRVGCGEVRANVETLEGASKQTSRLEKFGPKIGRGGGGFSGNKLL